MTELSVPLEDLVEDEAERTWLGDTLFTGRAIEVYENGETASTTSYVDGQEHGVQRIWRLDGTLESECPMVHGQPEGRARDWHRSGALAKETVFGVRGRPLSWRSWDESGRLTGEGDWDGIYGPPAAGSAAAAGR